jgi:hypothetical protein
MGVLAKQNDVATLGFLEDLGIRRPDATDLLEAHANVAPSLRRQIEGSAKLLRHLLS